MSNVIPIKPKEELKHCSYYDLEGDIGVSMLDRSIQVIRLNQNEIELGAYGKSKVYTREELAEFFQVVTVMLDPDNRYLPKFDLIGLDY